MCEEWADDFAAFLRDMGERPVGHTLDRYPNPNGDYEPGNCRWATLREQANNCRSNRLIKFRGRTKTIAEWADVVGVSADSLKRRFGLGWSTERALTAPYRRTSYR